MMSLYHAGRKLVGHWSVDDTARAFSVSIGLVSENLKLAKAFDDRPELAKVRSRQEALDILSKKQRRSVYKDEDDD